MSKSRKGPLSGQRVTYILEMDGTSYIIGNLPAKVDTETGEQFFAPSMAEHLQGTVLAQTEPSKVIENPHQWA